MSIGRIEGGPGYRSETLFSPRVVGRDAMWSYLAGGSIIDAVKSRDVLNTAQPLLLRAGLLMGKVTASGKMANSFFGVTQGAYTSGGTSLTLTAAQAVELVRRQGATGTFTTTGPPTAAGTVAVTTTTYSAVNTSTGVVTVTSLGVDKVAGSFIGAVDGSQTPTTMICDGAGILVASDGSDTPWPLVPVAGTVYPDKLLPSWPADASLKAWIRAALNPAGGGVFVFPELIA